MRDAELSPDLLRRLAEHAERIDRSAETSMSLLRAEIVEKDGRGTVLHTIRSVAEIRRVGGRRVTTVLSATRDEREYRTEAQKRADAEDRKQRAFDSPFAAASRSRYAFRTLPPEGSLLRIAVEPASERHATTDVLRGEATIDVETGECVRLAGGAARQPPFVHEMRLAFQYDVIGGQGRMLSSVEFSVAGGIPLLQRRVDGRFLLEYHPL